MRACVSVYTDECVGRVCEWARVCLPAGHLAVNSLGSPRGEAATTTIAQPSTSGCRVLGQEPVWGISNVFLRKEPPDCLPAPQGPDVSQFPLPQQGCAHCHHPVPESGDYSTYRGTGSHLPDPGYHGNCERDRIWLRRLWLDSRAKSSSGRDSQGGAGCRNSMAGTGLPQAENHWRLLLEHPTTTPCYSITVGLFPCHLGEIQNLYLKLSEALAGFGQP